MLEQNEKNLKQSFKNWTDKDGEANSAWLQTTRNDLIKFMKDNPKKQKKTISECFNFFQITICKPAFALAMIIIMLLASSGGVYASYGSIPGDITYPIKLARENIKLMTADDPQEKMRLNLEFAQNRIDELAKMQAQPNTSPKLEKETINRLEKQIIGAHSVVRRIAEPQKKAESALALEEITTKELTQLTNTNQNKANNPQIELLIKNNQHNLIIALEKSQTEIADKPELSDLKQTLDTRLQTIKPIEPIVKPVVEIKPSEKEEEPIPPTEPIKTPIITPIKPIVKPRVEKAPVKIEPIPSPPVETIKAPSVIETPETRTETEPTTETKTEEPLSSLTPSKTLETTITPTKTQESAEAETTEPVKVLSEVYTHEVEIIYKTEDTNEEGEETTKTEEVSETKTIPAQTIEPITVTEILKEVQTVETETEETKTVELQTTITPTTPVTRTPIIKATPKTTIELSR